MAKTNMAVSSANIPKALREIYFHQLQKRLAGENTSLILDPLTQRCHNISWGKSFQLLLWMSPFPPPLKNTVKTGNKTNTKLKGFAMGQNSPLKCVSVSLVKFSIIISTFPSSKTSL